MAPLRVLYAGDGPADGAARYLLGVLHAIGAKTVHVPPTQPLTSRVLQQPFDVVILSDFPKRGMAKDAESRLVKQVQNGCGLLMVGGWASFSGPFGRWHRSLVETVLPVTCQAGDDRVNTPSGALLVGNSSTVWRGVSLQHPPVVCGVNAVRAKPGSRVVLWAKPIQPHVQSSGAVTLRLSARAYPALVLRANQGQRTAVLTTDVAPHWCGGLVDWGHHRVTLRIPGGVRAEVGERYVQFLTQLMYWLAGIPVG